MIGGVTIMGILNATPDSFSDGGRWTQLDKAVAHGLRMVEDGADIIDVGGESTRPGARPLDEEEERRRVLPIISRLASEGVAVSVDTLHASTAVAAVGAGAVLVNDVSGGLADPAMVDAVAPLPARFLVMHWRGRLRRGDHPRYDDVVSEVIAHLRRRVEACEVAGIDRDRIIVDPGLGFSKTAEHNWSLLRRLPALVSEGLPVLVAASRKRFLAAATGAVGYDDHALHLLDAATAAVSLMSAQAGAWGVRVHDVPSTAASLAAWSRWADAEDSVPSTAGEAAHV